MRVAIVHEWLVTYAGSERVVEQMLKVYPDAVLFTLVDGMKPEERPAFLEGVEVRTSFLQTLPFAARRHRAFLPLMPLAVEQHDLTDFDLVLSSQHCVSHGAVTAPGQTHLSYVHSPARYAWDLSRQYLRGKRPGFFNTLRSMPVWALLHYVRLWDQAASDRVDAFAVNSRFIGERVRKFYKRAGTVIHPPVDVDRFTAAPGSAREDFYLTAARMVPYKRVGRVVEAFRDTPGRRLVVVGDGPEEARVRRLAAGADNIEFRGFVPGAELVDLLGRARAFVFAAEEDFGIGLVEAQACGTPVLAYGRGGARDIVADGDSGLLFGDQSPAAVRAAVDRFEAEGVTWDAARIREHSLQFSEAEFRRKLRDWVDAEVARVRDAPLAPAVADGRRARSHGIEPARVGAPPVGDG